MATLNMSGPYKLNNYQIDAAVREISPGNYALGLDGEKFTVHYVGRSDDDLNKRLKQWVGKDAKYKDFKASYASSPKAAFEKECQNYHDFGEKESLDNDIHPQRPANANWRCPVCGS
jgi:hypothetical protein